MQIQTITTDYMGSHCYIVIENEHAFIIDPGDADLVRDAILDEMLHVDFGILTHEHCDHIYGCERLKEEFHCKMISSSICDENMRNSRKNFSQYYDAFVNIQTKLPIEEQKIMKPFSTNADEVFDGERAFDWMGHKLYLRETPGHSQGSICVQLDDDILFTGDTLMRDDSTITQFPGGSRKDFREKTLPWLRSLPNDMMVYPGHGDGFKLVSRLDHF